MMAVRHPPAPFTAPASGSLEQRLAAVAEAINGKASAQVAPSYHWLRLIDPIGQTWQITVDTSGALHTEVVPR